MEGMIEYLEKEEDKAFYRAIVHGPNQPARRRRLLEDGGE